MKLFKALSFLALVAGAGMYLYTRGILRPLPVAVSLAMLVLATGVQLVIHELGHLVGGLLTGYRLVCFQIGRLNLAADGHGRLGFHVRRTRGGQCIMEPGEGERLRYLGYNLGGVAANALAMAASLLLLPVPSPYAAVSCLMLFYTGLMKLIPNLIPRISETSANDGGVVRLLGQSLQTRRDYRNYLRLYCALFRGEAVELQQYRYAPSPDQTGQSLLYYNAIRDLLEDPDL